MLGHVVTKTRGGGSLRSWASPICVAWMPCVAVAGWLLGRDDYLYGEEGSDPSMGSSTHAMFLVASVLGLAIGVAMVVERRTRSILPTVLTAALLGAIALAVASPEQDLALGLLVIGFFYLAVTLGVPVLAGALLGAVWRPALSLLHRRSAHRLNGGGN